jgi:hypothetical protein
VFPGPLASKPLVVEKEWQQLFLTYILHYIYTGGTVNV